MSLAAHFDAPLYILSGGVTPLIMSLATTSFPTLLCHFSGGLFKGFLLMDAQGNRKTLQQFVAQAVGLRLVVILVQGDLQIAP